MNVRAEIKYNIEVYQLILIFHHTNYYYKITPTQKIFYFKQELLCQKDTIIKIYNFNTMKIKNIQHAYQYTIFFQVLFS